MKQFTLLSLFVTLCIVFACNKKDATDTTCGPDSTAFKQAIVWMPTNPADSTATVDSLKRAGLQITATCPCNQSLQLWGADTPIFGNEGPDGDKRKPKGGSGGSLGALNISPNYEIAAPVASGFTFNWENIKPPITGKVKNDAIIIGVIDSGLDNKMNSTVPFWVNANERGGDEDRNGLRGDINGWDFTTLSATSSGSHDFQKDESQHGTVVTAFIAEELQNAPYQVMPIKILDKDKKGRLFNAICAMEYARQQITKRNTQGILNLSWGYYDLPSTALDTMLQKLQKDNIVVVAAAGNEDTAADRCETAADKRNLSKRTYKFYPAAYQFDNLIVATTLTSKDPSEQTYGYSLAPAPNQNYSKDYVDIGVVADTSYEFYLPYTKKKQKSWGSSFAAPIVTAQVAKAINGGVRQANKNPIFVWLTRNPVTGIKYVGEDAGLNNQIKDGKITKRGIKP